jgi:ring-1,2-phenylacetyl-CoA epoxidase subunit PaaB
MTTEETQWPRFEVFQQTSPGSPFENAGSVHAPDAEVALQNARDVFVRRPQTIALWVVPASAILAVTREELDAMTPPEIAESAAAEQTYHVFTKTSQRRAMTFVSHCGDVMAATAWAALEKALASDLAPGAYVWWIVPASAVTSSRPEDQPSFFDPAHDKVYRLPGAYRTRTLMDEIRQTQSEPDNATGS